VTVRDEPLLGSAASAGYGQTMRRRVQWWLAFVAVALGLASASGAHRCAIAAAAAAHVPSGCCPEKAARDAERGDGPEACAGSCCAAEDAITLAPAPAGWAAPPPASAELSAPDRRVSVVSPLRVDRPRPRALGARGPPPDPPAAPPYVRHRALLL